MTQVYIAVPVSERLPDKKEEVSLSMDGGETFPYMGKLKFPATEMNVTHWLEPREGYFLEREELEKWEYEKKNLEMQIGHRQYLIDAQKEYIEFLGKNISDNAVYLEIHGMGASEEIVAKGKELREKIKKYSSLEPNTSTTGKTECE